MRSVRIGLFSERGATTPPLTQGGTERSVHMLATGLAAQGHEVTVWASPGSRATEYELRPYPPRHRFFEAQELRELADYDAVHMHWMGPNWTGFRFVERVLRARGALVQTYHGNFPYYIRPYAAWLRARKPSRRPHFVTQTRQQVEYAWRHGIPNVTQIPNPAPDLPFGPTADDFLLYLGRIIPAKGIETAIEVARQSRKRLVIAGPGERGYVDRVIGRAGGTVEYLGEVDEATKLGLLQTARALVFPSRFPEGMPLTVLEAAVSGTPVVSSDQYGAAREVIEDGVNGFVCRDLDEMVRAVERVDGLDRRACRDSILARFSREEIVQRHLELYGFVFGDRDGRRLRAATPLGKRIVAARSL